MKLEQLADVIIGVLVNREKNVEGDYEYSLFNLKAYEERTDEYLKIKTKNSFDKQVTKNGDLVFRLICPNKVIYISEKYTSLLVPSQMCIIRPNKELIDPIFLKWYLESDLCKDKIALNVTGSTIQKISVNALRKIEIPELKLETQKKIRDLIELWQKEKEVLEMTIDTKEKLYNNIIEEIIEKNK